MNGRYFAWNRVRKNRKTGMFEEAEATESVWGNLGLPPCAIRFFAAGRAEAGELKFAAAH